MSTIVLLEPLSVVYPRLANLLEDVHEARWTIEAIASDMHRANSAISLLASSARRASTRSIQARSSAVNRPTAVVQSARRREAELRSRRPIRRPAPLAITARYAGPARAELGGTSLSDFTRSSRGPSGPAQNARIRVGCCRSSPTLGACRRNASHRRAGRCRPSPDAAR